MKICNISRTNLLSFKSDNLRIEKMENHAPLEISMPTPNTYLVETYRNDGTKVSIFRQVETIEDCLRRPLFVTETNERGIIRQFINILVGPNEISPRGSVTLNETGVSFYFKGFAKNPKEVTRIINNKNRFTKTCTPEYLRAIVEYIRKGKKF